MFYVTCSLLFVLSSLAVIQYARAELVVTHPIGRTPEDTRYRYMTELLALLLDKTSSDYGGYRLEGYAPMTQHRIIREIQVGRLDVAQLPISQQANRLLRPIEIPIRKGILGWRILIIHRDNAKAFEAVKTLPDLKAFKAGFGEQWGDLPVLEHNVGPVITGIEYDNLFRMLQHKRFGYLHRGIHEPWDEIASHRDCCPDLQVEQTLLIHYSIGDYLYVSKENPELFNRLADGFTHARKDGSFDALFKKEYGALIEKANVKDRKLIRFSNPYLPESTPINDDSLWLKVRQGI